MSDYILRTIRRETFLLPRFLCAFAALFAGLTLSAEESRKPNIVFILADDMSRDTWGTYGSVDCKTPNIDKLASEGLRFDRAYCAAAMCAPFRQELYSGRTPWRTGTLANHTKSKEGTKSIPHYLQPLGYRVALMGKTHVGPKECYPFEYIKGGNKGKDQNPIFLEETKKFIESSTGESKPFCLFIASSDSHAPFTTGDPSAYDASKLTIPPYWLDTPELREVMTQYYAEITNFDLLVGGVRKILEERNLWENTLFMVCSEQGTQLPFAKWTCYDNGLHTGLVAHWAGVIKPGSVTDELVSIADVTPTLVDAAGGTQQAGAWDGKSFLKMLKGKKQVINDYVYGAFTNCNIINNRDRIFPIRVIRDKSFTLIYNPNHESVTSNVTLTGALSLIQETAPQKNKKSSKNKDIGASWVKLSQKEPSAKPLVYKLHHRPEFELYHLGKDPYELKNEIDNPEYKEEAKRLKQQLMKRLDELGDSDPIATEKSLVKKGK